MNDFYVYAWLRPCGAPFYIGKGLGRRAQTMKRHNPMFMRIVAKIRRGGGVPRVVRWQDGLLEADAFRLECAYIKLFGRRDNGTGVLANMTDGGEGGAGHAKTEDAKRRIRLSNLGQKRTPESCEKIGAAKRGITLTDEHRAKIAKSTAISLSRSEVRSKISASLIGNRRRAGVPHTDETKAILSALHTGKVNSLSARAKMSEKNRLIGPRSNNTSGYKGVTFHPATGKWYARITAGSASRNISLGLFPSPEDAARAYDAAAASKWGAGNCYLNFPEERSTCLGQSILLGRAASIRSI